MSSGSPPRGEGDQSSTATDRPSGELPEFPLPVRPAVPDLRDRYSRVRPRRLRSSGFRSGKRDPADAVLPHPVVPEEERFCRVCRSPVGRGGVDTGYCPQCGSAFSFVPRLHPGEVVAGRYDVWGVLSLNSMGTVYLAQDRAVSYQWVVLRELADTVVDRRFLAELDHPNLAKAYDFVASADVGNNKLGYLVTEHVDGESLRDVALESRRGGEQLSLLQMLIYGLEILSAVDYVHSKGLRCSDLTPDNVILDVVQPKLVGLDAVRRMDDPSQAAADLYAVGRTLAVVSEFLFPMPDSYGRFLRRATHVDPARRFSTVEEMVVQLTGVLREVGAEQSNRPWPGTSTLFEPPVLAFGTTVVPDPDQPVPRPDTAEVVAMLPHPRVDPAADALSASLQRVRAWLDLGKPLQAEVELAEARDVASPYDWRFLWYRGLVHLASERWAALTVFEAVCDELPGELAPKLALAVSAEMMGPDAGAGRYYEEVWRTDHAYVSAAFGLARMRLARGDRVGAVSVLDAVPATSPQYTAARVAVIKIKIAGEPAEEDLVDAASRLAPPIAATERLRLSIAVLEAADRLVRSKGSRPGAKLLGWALTERDLRAGLKQCRRALARHTAGAEPPPASRWHVFVDGLAESLVPVPRRRHRPRRSGWERIEARIHERYRTLGPPEAAETPTGKDRHR